jgi:hypothetical protein
VRFSSVGAAQPRPALASLVLTISVDDAMTRSRAQPESTPMTKAAFDTIGTCDLEQTTGGIAHWYGYVSGSSMRNGTIYPPKPRTWSEIRERLNRGRLIP